FCCWGLRHLLCKKRAVDEPRYFFNLDFWVFAGGRKSRAVGSLYPSAWTGIFSLEVFPPFLANACLGFVLYFDDRFVGIRGPSLRMGESDFGSGCLRIVAYDQRIGQVFSGHLFDFFLCPPGRQWFFVDRKVLDWLLFGFWNHSFSGINFRNGGKIGPLPHPGTVARVSSLTHYSINSCVNIVGPGRRGINRRLTSQGLLEILVLPGYQATGLPGENCASMANNA
ncbi:MAG: hypothetical protein PHN49_08285, partial [Candidatus Omnitrophica bacterium]|nr:hypothetical protein [Candidatus Omnitrophota bacterium]